MRNLMLCILTAAAAAALGCSQTPNDAPQTNPTGSRSDTGTGTDTSANEDSAPPPDLDDMSDSESPPESDAETPGDEDTSAPPEGGDPGGDCDPFEQDCPEQDSLPMQCVPIDGVPRCVAQNPSQHVADEPCDGGDCAPGLTCVTWSDGRGQICTQMCPTGDSGLCPDGQECSAWLRSNPNIGICRPPRASCDIYLQDCEEEGFSCTFGRDSETNDPIFVCEPAGPNAETEACADGNGRCQAGLICIRDDETQSSCHSVCQTDEECGVEGQSCAGRSATWQVTFCR